MTPTAVGLRALRILTEQCVGWTLEFYRIGQALRRAGYHFLFRTDHWLPSDAAADRQAYPLLWLDGIDLDVKDERGVYFHIVCLRTFKGIDRSIA